MRWSLGSTALLVALTAGSHVMAAEPADPARGGPVARPAIWPSRGGLGFLSGNHVRPVSMGDGGVVHGSGEVVAGEGYDGGAIEGGYVYGPGSCDYQMPCVNGLWNGYVKRPLWCGHGHHGRGCGGGCGGGWAYSGLGAGCGGCGCGLKLHNWFKRGGDCGCADGCDSAADCGSGSCGGGGFAGFGKHHLRGGCDECDSCGHRHGFKHGGLGRFWAACFGDDCGCGDVGAGCGCANAAGGGAETIVPGPVGPAKPIEGGYGPTPAFRPQSEGAPALELNEEPVPPAPRPMPEEEAPQPPKEAKSWSLPSLRGFGGFGVK